nr:IS110 family transposase [Cohnella rhizosphaerae]
MTLRVCYEAGPTGYVLYRWLLTAGIACSVVAPSLIPKRAGDRVKTDKRDAIRLAQLYRAGELTPVYVPTPADESLRDLVRAREDAVEDLNRFKQRLGKFLLRHQLQDAKGAKPGTFAYEEWLDTLRFPEDSCKQMTFQEYRQSIWETKERIKRYEKQIEEQAALSEQAPVVQALQALRGVATVTAVTLSSEMMSSDRFHSASSFMSYCGLVSSEYSSGGSPLARPYYESRECASASGTGGSREKLPTRARDSQKNARPYRGAATGGSVDCLERAASITQEVLESGAKRKAQGLHRGRDCQRTGGVCMGDC